MRITRRVDARGRVWPRAGGPAAGLAAGRLSLAADANNCSCAARLGDGAAVPADGPSPPGGRW